MLRLLLSSVAVVLLASQARAQNVVETEVRKLTGVWLVTVDETDGHDTDPEILKQARVTITRDQFVVEFGDIRYAMTYQINPGGRPPQIDLITSVVDPRGGQSMLQRAGVYRLDGDRLRMATSSSGRPKRIRPGKGVQYWELKRAK